MYCPTCGANASTDQKFCRACGMELWVISQLVAIHLSATDRALLPVESDAGKLHRMTTLLFSGTVSFIIGLALLVADKQHDWIGPVGVLLLLAGTLIAAYGVLFPRWRIKRYLRTPLSQPATLSPVESTGLVSASHLEAKPSVNAASSGKSGSVRGLFRWLKPSSKEGRRYG